VAKKPGDTRNFEDFVYLSVLSEKISFFKKFLFDHGRDSFFDLLKLMTHEYYKIHDIFYISGSEYFDLKIILSGKIFFEDKRLRNDYEVKRN
jgi:hypothetical protein